MKQYLRLSIIFFLILMALPVRAQESKTEKSKLDLTQRWLVLSARQKELNEAAAAGYRPRMGLGKLLLERVAQPAETYQYVLRLTKPKEWEKGLNEAGALGFQLIPQALEVMEKAPGLSRHYQYKVVDTKHTPAWEREMVRLSQEGYRVVGLFGTLGFPPTLFLEKSEGMTAAVRTTAVEESPIASGERYRLLTTTKTSTAQKELSEAASAGYRILDAAAGELAFILEKSVAPGGQPEYLLLATERTFILEKEINDAAATGFRLLPQTLGAHSKFVADIEIFAVMEKDPSSSYHYQYLLLSTARISTMQKELAEASQQGYEPVAITVSKGGELIVVLEKSATQ